MDFSEIVRKLNVFKGVLIRHVSIITRSHLKADLKFERDGGSFLLTPTDTLLQEHVKHQRTATKKRKVFNFLSSNLMHTKHSGKQSS